MFKYPSGVKDMISKIEPSIANVTIFLVSHDFLIFSYLLLPFPIGIQRNIV
jgi:hypothetical protein